MAQRLDPDVSAMVDSWVDSGQATIPPFGVELLYLLDNTPCKRGSGCARNCKNNPFCLRHLGEKKWTEPTDEKTRKVRDKQLEVEHGMLQDGQKVGLRNLGATCYVNSLLQIWHHNPNLRREVFRWDPKVSPDDYSPNQKVMAQLQRVFAHLQCGNQPVYSPAPFVDALSLSHSIQQDGLEFCRLFMGIMESELQPCSGKQVSVIHSDYAGEYETAIRCLRCHKSSPRLSVFFELELYTKGQSRLEECIKSYFASEDLKESNKYDCDQCREKTGEKQEAQREVFLKKLPKVLVFHLLRFDYNFAKGTKTKIKDRLSFPEELDMSHYGINIDVADSTYRLQAILVHKGPSAFHGHYATQLRDENDTWWELDDDYTCNLSKSSKSKKGMQLGELQGEPVVKEPKEKRKKTKKKAGPAEDPDWNKDDTAVGAGSAHAVDESASERVPEHAATEASGSTRHFSRNVYMLTYHKVLRNEPAPQGPPQPADDVAEEVKLRNTELENSIKKRAQDAESATERIRTLYNTLGEDGKVWVKTEWLEKWLKHDAYAPENQKHEEIPDRDPISAQVAISNVDLLCEHKLLNPAKVRQCKLVQKGAFDTIVAAASKADYTELPKDTACCKLCMKTIFDKAKQKRILTECQYKVSQLVGSRRKQQEFTASDELYWVSKAALRSWLKLTTTSTKQEQPFNHQAACRHGTPPADLTRLQQVRKEVWELILQSFDYRSRVRTVRCSNANGTEEPCLECAQGELNEATEREATKKRVMNEKERLSNLYSAKRPRPTREQLVTSSEGESDDRFLRLYVLPTTFLESWRAWAKNSRHKVERPANIDVGPLMCEHGLLVEDFRESLISAQTEDEPLGVFVTEKEWKVLVDLGYQPTAMEGGIYVEKLGEGSEEGCGPFSISHTVCAECSKTRRETLASKFDLYEGATVWIRKINGKSSKDKGKAGDGARASDSGASEAFAAAIENATTPAAVDTAAAAASFRGNNRRAPSRRVKGCRKVIINSFSTLGELKSMVMNIFAAMPSDQHLFLDNLELDHQLSTHLNTLGIRPGDTLDLRVDEEAAEFAEDDPGKREIEYGFAGTALSSTPGPAPHTSKLGKEFDTAGAAEVTCVIDSGGSDVEELDPPPPPNAPPPPTKQQNQGQRRSSRSGQVGGAGNPGDRWSAAISVDVDTGLELEPPATGNPGDRWPAAISVDVELEAPAAKRAATPEVTLIESDGESNTTSRHFLNSKRQKTEPSAKKKKSRRAQGVPPVQSKRLRQQGSPDPSPELAMAPEGKGAPSAPTPSPNANYFQLRK